MSRTPEQLIIDLEKENKRFSEELKQAQIDLNSKHRMKMIELEQVISELEDEIEELRAAIDLNR